MAGNFAMIPLLELSLVDDNSDGLTIQKFFWILNWLCSPVSLVV